MITTHGYLSLTPPLALAVMEGRKTQTMRPMRVQPPERSPNGAPLRGVAPTTLPGGDGWDAQYEIDNPVFLGRAPYAPGDVLWVREPARFGGVLRSSDGGTLASVLYIADNERTFVPWPPRLKEPRMGHRIPNGCHREAARTYVRVLSVEPRRVQSITEEEARAEGLDPVPVHGRWAGPREEGGHWSARKPFAELWDSLYRAKGLGWDADPWCWCVRFERVEVRARAFVAREGREETDHG